ncbi:hypothetical protein BC332_07500 [Capsicum chinense]|nr:hypothetical protein BC332_07500 [Capsicum chinense]
MVCAGRILCSTTPFCSSTWAFRSSRYVHHGNGRNRIRWRSMASEADASSYATSIDSESSDKNAAGFCIIEGPETVEDFAKMELQEIRDNITSRRNKIFLHMEEVRRLRIQQRIKSVELGILSDAQENELPNFPSFIPFLPPLTSANLKQYYATCLSLIAGFMLFGGLLAPSLELKLGLGGTSYADFIRSMHLPMQLSQVDPIVASFSGGAVGVISSLMVVEINNVKQQEHKRCKYCLGTGYLACARCSNTGALVLIEPVSTINRTDKPLPPPKTERCPNCSGSGKVCSLPMKLPERHICKMPQNVKHFAKCHKTLSIVIWEGGVEKIQLKDRGEERNALSDFYICHLNPWLALGGQWKHIPNNASSHWTLVRDIPGKMGKEQGKSQAASCQSSRQKEAGQEQDFSLNDLRGKSASEGCLRKMTEAE